jgi:hypothetical protein
MTVGRETPTRSPLKRTGCRPDILDCLSSDAERRVPVVKQAPVKGRTAVKVNFVLPKDAVAGNVSVVGDFNGWDPLAHPLRPRRNGTRSAVVTLPPGRRFAFRYLAEGGRWHDDDTTGAVEPNGIGGYNTVIHT